MGKAWTAIKVQAPAWVIERLEAFIVILKLYSPKSNAAEEKKAVVTIARQLAVDLLRIFNGQTKAETCGLINLRQAS